jgi:hypothetical protein
MLYDNLLFDYMMLSDDIQYCQVCYLLSTDNM